LQGLNRGKLNSTWGQYFQIRSGVLRLKNGMELSSVGTIWRTLVGERL
jgi:hypothetical protein